MSMIFCWGCGKQIHETAPTCPQCGAAQVIADSAAPSLSRLFAPAIPGANSEEQTIRRMADYEHVSAILWLILGICQVLTIILIVAGIWNIFAAWSRFKISPLIRARDPRVPALYEGIAQLIVIGVVNLIFGGLIGILFVAFDFVIRDMVLSNRHLFSGLPQAGQVSA